MGFADPVAVRRLDEVMSGRAAAVVPELFFAEVANVALKYVRARVWSPRVGGEVAAAATVLSAVPVSVRALAGAAYARAVETGLSAYDACYLVLAEAEGATLVTADRRLAELAPRAELVGG